MRILHVYMATSTGRRGGEGALHILSWEKSLALNSRVYKGEIKHLGSELSSNFSSELMKFREEFPAIIASNNEESKIDPAKAGNGIKCLQAERDKLLETIGKENAYSP